MDFRASDQQEILRQTVREFAEAEIRPHIMTWDEAQHFPDELVPRLAALGLMGIQIPEEYGGAGMSAVDYCICIEELARVDPSVALTVAAHNGLCTSHIFLFGDEAQKRRYLVPLARGEMLWGFGLTEPGAGSDAGGRGSVRLVRLECHVDLLERESRSRRKASACRAACPRAASTFRSSGPAPRCAANPAMVGKRNSTTTSTARPSICCEQGWTESPSATAPRSPSWPPA